VAEIGVVDEEEADGGRGSSGGARQLPLHLLQLWRGFGFNSGEHEPNWGEGLLRHDQGEEGRRVVWRMSTGDVSFYRLIEQLWTVTGADGEMVLRAARVQDEDGLLFMASWRSSQAFSHRKRWSSTVVSSTRPAVL
jgi:hypothetical protein